MSELRVNAEFLDSAIQGATTAGDEVSQVHVADGMSEMSLGMPGAGCLRIVGGVSDVVDSMARELSQALGSFADALSGAKALYLEVDESTSVDFRAFDERIGGL